MLRKTRLFTNKFVYYRWVYFLLFFNKVSSESNFFFKLDKYEIVQDFPTNNDLNVYLGSLERVIDFSYDIRKDLDLNFSYGLFLIYVNLISFVTGGSLPMHLHYRLNKILEKNYMALKYFNEEIHEVEYDLIKISNILKRSKTWSKKLKRLNLGLPRWMKESSERITYPDWNTYVAYVEDLDHSNPGPKVSDSCMRFLEENEESDMKYPKKCKVPEYCHVSLFNGTHFGYALSHRFLFLLVAHVDRGCVFISPAEDRTLRDKFCQIMFIEADFIAGNEYGLPDLMFEQIALCTLDSHAEFIRQTWLSNLLRSQTPDGCFGYKMLNNLQTYEDQDEYNGDFRNGTCSGHTTAVAGASLAAAIRLLLENYN